MQRSMRMKIRRALCLLCAGAMVVSGTPMHAITFGAQQENGVIAKEESNDLVTYKLAASDLEVLDKWGAEETKENGKYTVSFQKQYSQIFYKIPEEIDMTGFQSVTVETDASQFSIKLCQSENNFQAGGVTYGSDTLTNANLNGEVALEDLSVLAFMNLAEGELVKDIKSVTFTVKKTDKAPTEEKSEGTDDAIIDERTEITYTLKELTAKASWGVETQENENGDAVLTFPKKYNQIFYEIPAEIDMNRFQSVTVDTNSEHFSVKLCLGDSAFTEAGVVYGATTLTTNNLKLPEGKNISDASILAFMSLADDVEKTVKSVTFHLAPVEKPEKLVYDYTMEDLEKTASWNVEIEDAEDGAKNYNFTKQYGAASYRIPEEVDCSRLQSIIVDASDKSSLSVKFFGDEEMQKETAVTYGNNVLSADGLKPEDLKCFGIMGLKDDYATTIKGVTFKLAPKKEEAAVDTSLKNAYKKKGELNPLVTQRYSADPGVMVYDDTVYVYSTNDVYEYENGNIAKNTYGKIKTINCFSSHDLVNWTDHGAIPVAGRGNEEGAAKWANNSWAPCAAHKTINGQEKFFLYFADNGSGIGVLTSDSPTGPWVDPLGEQIISRDTPNCRDITWLFDPAVMVDDDGSAYLAFGGGVPEGKEANPGNARIVKLGEDMISLAGDPVTIDVPYLFEDSGINKIGDKYVYSYCSNWNTAGSNFKNARIYYMTADDPMGPYTLAGEVLKNPGEAFSGDGGNNHHSIFEWKNNYYVAYHARSVDSQIFGKTYDYRSAQIDKLTLDENGMIQGIAPTMKGVTDAVAYVNPYERVEAETIYRQGGITVAGVGNTVVTDTVEGDWIGVRGADFTKGLSSITVKVKAEEASEIEVRVGSEKGTVLGTIDIEATNGEFKEFTGEFDGLSGNRDLYFRFNGPLEFDSWVAKEGEILDVEEIDEVTGDDVEFNVPDLKDKIAERFDEDFITGVSITGGEINDEKLMALVTKHFNAITPGNELKPDCMFGYASKCPGKNTITFNGKEMDVPTLDFSRAESILDKILAWNEKNPEDFIRVRGHVLVWHSQTPEWFFHENYDENAPYCSKEEMTLRQEWYIKSVLEHFVGADSKYQKLFYGWDVVNEAVSDGSGTYRNGDEKSSWWKVYGSNEFIINAFRFANKYAPANVELYYNDYNEWYDAKSDGIAQLIKDVKKAEGTRIDAVGMQGHYQTEGTPSAEAFMKAAKKYAAAGVKVQVTELDMAVSNTYDGTDKTLQEEYTKEAYRYKEIYDAIATLREQGVKMSGMTIWGVIDKNSWLQTANSVGGASDGTKKQLPLLFDDNYHVKPAYWALVDDSKLEPSIKTVAISEAVDDKFTAGSILNFAKGDTAVTVTPVWTEKEILFKIQVEDATVEDEDKVVLYTDFGSGITKNAVARTDATATKKGYETVIAIPAATKMGMKFAFDVMVQDGATKLAYNDYTFKQEKKNNYYAIATLKPFATVEKGTITVGEDNSALWEKVAPVELGIVAGAKASAKAKLLWDEKNLYVQVAVVDPELNAEASADHEKDSVEIFIDENNAKSASYQEDDKQYRINYLNEQTFNGTKCSADHVTSKVTLTEDGYLMEAAFAWTDISPAAGQSLGLELQINDADKSAKRIGTLNWSDESGNGWSSPAVFGTVVLVDSAKAPEENPENPGTEVTDPENPGTEVTDPENPGTEVTDPEEPGTEVTDPEEPEKPQAPTVQEVVKETVKAVVEVATTVVEKVAPVVKKTVEAVAPVVEKAVEIVAPVVEKVVETVAPVVKAAGKIVKGIFGKLFR